MALLTAIKKCAGRRLWHCLWNLSLWQLQYLLLRYKRPQVLKTAAKTWGCSQGNDRGSEEKTPAPPRPRWTLAEKTGSTGWTASSYRHRLILRDTDLPSGAPSFSTLSPHTRQGGLAHSSIETAIMETQIQKALWRFWRMSKCSAWVSAHLFSGR